MITWLVASFSKDRSFDWITKRDIAFMNYMIEGHPIIHPFLMLSHIKEVTRKNKSCLPYGMVFALIFQEFGKDCTSENAKRLLHTNRYIGRSLYWMGYQKVDGRWVRYQK